jgi:hypothetical protein
MEWMKEGDFELELHPNIAVVSMLEAAAALVDLFATMQWRRVSFPAPVLITSDKPVSLWAENRHSFSGVGVATADQISLPISPHKAFVIFPQGDDHGTKLPSADELVRRTVSGAGRWLFTKPGWWEMTGNREPPREERTNESYFGPPTLERRQS